MRQVISFLFASALLVGGLYLLYMQVFHSHTIYGMMLMGAAMGIIGGGAWLINDFVLPAIRKKDSS